MSPRATGIIGIAAFVLIVVATLLEPLWDAPGTTASSREIATYLADNRAGFIGALIAYAFVMLLFLAFLAGVWSWLSDQPGVARELNAAFGFGSVALCATVWVGFAPALVLAYRAPDVEEARLLWDLSFAVLALSGAPTALATAAFAAIVLRTRLLPPYTAWLAVLAAVAHVVLLFTFIPDDGFFSLEGFVIVAIPTTMFVWMFATGIAMTRVGR